MIEGPGGDLLRLIGGGGPVALQNLYLRRQIEKQRKRNEWLPDIFPALLGDVDEKGNTIQRIRWAMRKNIPKRAANQKSVASPRETSKLVPPKSKTDSQLKMSLTPHRPLCPTPTWSQAAPICAFARPLGRRCMTMSVLI
jgi:hypothetical protein